MTGDKARLPLSLEGIVEKRGIAHYGIEARLHGLIGSQLLHRHTPHIYPTRKGRCRHILHSLCAGFTVDIHCHDLGLGKALCHHQGNDTRS